ncbi:MAG: alginate export family protein [Granulosicoccus sp.]
MKKQSVACCLCVHGILVLITTPGLAQEMERHSASDRSRLSIEAKIELDISGEYNYELKDDGEYTYTIEPSAELEIKYEYTDDMEIVAVIEYGREMKDGNDDREREYQSSLDVDEAFVEFLNLPVMHSSLEDIALTLGRSKISDSREWFYDAGVDGLVLEATSKIADTDLLFSVNREEWIGSDMLRSNETDTVTNLLVVVTHKPIKSTEIGAYGIIRKDSSSDNDSPVFVGLSARGELFNKRLDFWSDFIMVTGEEEDEPISGNGFDLGATWMLTESGKFYATMGYAFGSGDGDVDSDFRQTGLHGNSGNFGGIASFKYYGEVVEPELSNLKILTAGIGFRPKNRMSLDLIYHQYAQDVALDELRDTNLDTDPNGESTDIGAELDLVAAYEGKSGVETELVMGYFQPGKAFDDDAEDALLINVTFTYAF